MELVSFHTDQQKDRGEGKIQTARTIKHGQQLSSSSKRCQIRRRLFTRAAQLPLLSCGPSHLGPELESSAGVRIPPVSLRPMWKGFKWHSGCSHTHSSELATPRAPHTAWCHAYWLTAILNLSILHHSRFGACRVGASQQAKRNRGFSPVLNYLCSNWYIALVSKVYVFLAYKNK